MFFWISEEPENRRLASASLTKLPTGLSSISPLLPRICTASRLDCRNASAANNLVWALARVMRLLLSFKRAHSLTQSLMVTIRLWVNECARLKDNNKRITLASAQTKLFAAEAFLQSSLDAVHILGSSGLIEDNPVGNLVSDALASRLFSGSSEIQKNIIAALLGTGEGYK